MMSVQQSSSSSRSCVITYPKSDDYYIRDNSQGTNPDSHMFCRNHETYPDIQMCIRDRYYLGLLFKSTKARSVRRKISLGTKDE